MQKEKFPLSVTEVTDGLRKLSFDVSFRNPEGKDETVLVKDLARRVGQLMMRVFRSTSVSEGLVGFFFRVPNGVVDADGVRYGKAQFVFPGLVVNAERARTCRRYVVATLAETPALAELAKFDPTNELEKVFHEMKSESEVPITGAVCGAASNLHIAGQLIPLAEVTMTENAVVAQPLPKERHSWIVETLKRLDMRRPESRLSEPYVEPQIVGQPKKKGKRTGPGGSRSSGTSSTPSVQPKTSSSFASASASSR